MHRKFFAAASLLALTSCGNLAPVAASLAPTPLSPETVATMRDWCARGAPLIAIAQGQNTIPQAREIAGYVAPLPATTDSNSPAWLLRNIGGLAQALGLSPW